MVDKRRREDLSVREVLYVLWGRKKLVGGIVMVLVGIGLLLGISQERTYSAESVVSVVPVEQGLGQLEREVFLEGVTGVSASDAVLQQTIARTGWQGSFEDFRDRLEPEYFVRENGDSGVIIRFAGRSPEEATMVVNTFAAIFVGRVETLNEERIAEGQTAADVSIRTEAAADSVQSSPGPLFYSGVALVVGVVLGGAIALLLEGRTRNWRDARDAEMTLQAPVLGAIPDYSVFVESDENHARATKGTGKQ